MSDDDEMSELCVSCGEQSPLLMNKPYCVDCKKKLVKECKQCHYPYTTLESFTLHKDKCNTCQKTYLKNKKKSETLISIHSSDNELPDLSDIDREENKSKEEDDHDEEANKKKKKPLKRKKKEKKETPQKKRKKPLTETNTKNDALHDENKDVILPFYLPMSIVPIYFPYHIGIAAWKGANVSWPFHTP